MTSAEKSIELAKKPTATRGKVYWFSVGLIALIVLVSWTGGASDYVDQALTRSTLC